MYVFHACTYASVCMHMCQTCCALVGSGKTLARQVTFAVCISRLLRVSWPFSRLFPVCVRRLFPVCVRRLFPVCVSRLFSVCVRRLFPVCVSRFFSVLAVCFPYVLAVCFPYVLAVCFPYVLAVCFVYHSVLPSHWAISILFRC